MAPDVQRRCALVISECQRGVIEPGMGGYEGLIDQVRQRDIVPRLAQLANVFRATNMPVLHMTVAHRPDFVDVPANTLLTAMARKNRALVSGSAEAEIVADLSPAPQDFVVERSSGLIGFCGTALDAMLRRMRIEAVVIAGVSTNVAVAGCSMVAADLGYDVLIPEDCIAAGDSVTHDVIVKNQLRMIARIMTAAQIASRIRTLP